MSTETEPKTEQSPVLPEPAPQAEPKTKKKKKKSSASAPPERAAFLDGFPRDPELDVLVDAFVQGNYARVRTDAPKLAERTSDAAVRDAALDLRRRIEPDPLARYILLASIALLLVLAAIALRGHG